MFRTLIGSFVLGLLASTSAQALTETRSIEVPGLLSDYGLTGFAVNGRTVAAGNDFVDTYTFKLGSTSDVEGGFDSLFRYRATGIVRGIVFDSITLSGNNVSIDALPLFSYSALNAGSYVLTVAGRAVGSQGGSYYGEFTAMPAIPEPATIALTLAGVGVVSLLARRRSVN